MNISKRNGTKLTKSNPKPNKVQDRPNDEEFVAKALKSWLCYLHYSIVPYPTWKKELDQAIQVYLNWRKQPDAAAMAPEQ
jgi:hypothetical protein